MSTIIQNGTNKVFIAHDPNPLYTANEKARIEAEAARVEAEDAREEAEAIREEQEGTAYDDAAVGTITKVGDYILDRFTEGDFTEDDGITLDDEAVAAYAWIYNGSNQFRAVRDRVGGRLIE